MDSQSGLQRSEHKKPTLWVAVLVGVLLCALVTLLWWMLNNKKYADYYAMLGIEANRLANNISTDLRDRIPSLQHIVKRWEFHKGIPVAEFTMDIEAYITDMPGFQAIALVDKNYYVKLIIPLTGNEQAQNLNLGFEEKRRTALEKATSKRNRTPTMTSSLELVQGGKGFQVDFPVFIDGKLDGFVLAIFRAPEWLTYIFDLKKTTLGTASYKMAVFMDDTIIFTQPGWNIQKYNFVTATTEIMDHRFKVQLTPTEVFFKRNQTFINEWIALGGFFFPMSRMWA